MFVHYKLWARAVCIHVKRPALFFSPLCASACFSACLAAMRRSGVPAGACVRVRRKLQKHELVNSDEGRGLVVVWRDGRRGEEKKEGLEVAGPGSPEISQNSALPAPSPPRPNVRDRPPSTQKPHHENPFPQRAPSPIHLFNCSPPFFFPCACFSCSFASHSEYPGGVYVHG